MPAPYSHAVYQIVKPSDLGGGTHYANINKCLGDYATLSAENYARTLDFERIRTVSDVTGLEFPLVRFLTEIVDDFRQFVDEIWLF